MSNQYGYKDYQSPNLIYNNINNLTEDPLDDLNSLKKIQWIDGDSLSPPCGSSIPLIDEMISLINKHYPIHTSNVSWYDLGCGDGRVCLQVYQDYIDNYTNKTISISCVGIECEVDLVQKFKSLIYRLPSFKNLNPSNFIHILYQDLMKVLKELLKQCKKGKDTFLYKGNRIPIPTIMSMYLLPCAMETIEVLLTKLMKAWNGLLICIAWGLEHVTYLEELNIRGTRLLIYGETKCLLCMKSGGKLW